ncbi:MAG: hypothetical protein QM820_58725 [Minicystis sp.]
MKMLRPFLLAVPVVLSAAACNVPGGDDDALEPADRIGTAEQAWAANKPPIKPPAGMNGKNPDCFWNKGTMNAYRLLASGALNYEGTGQVPNVSNMFPSEKCYIEAMENAIGCALAEGKTLSDAQGNVFSGWWGLAEGWSTGPLDSDGRRWVTGCMAERLNALGFEVAILLEGKNDAIHFNAFWQSYMTFNESNAYGDVFAGPDNTISPVYVCWSPDLEQLCIDTGCNPSDYLDKRICDTDHKACNLVIIGKCADRCYTNATNPYPTCIRPDSTYDDHPVHVRLEPPI